MSAPKVSIIIPCYNAEAWVATTLESAFAQTWPSKEIIFVNDGSKDGSLAVARGFEKRGLHILDKPNGGASAARNAGIRAATGDYFQFLDADDLINPEKIELQLARLATAKPGAVASCEWARFRGDPALARFVAEPNWHDYPVAAEFMRFHFNTGFMMQPAAWLTPRAVVDAAGPWDERLTLNDDGEYFCRVLLASQGIVFTPGARVYYRSGIPTSLSARADDAAHRSHILSFELCAQWLLADDGGPATREAMANAFQTLAYFIYPDMPREAREAERRARVFGGATRPWEAGPRLKAVGRILGWRRAKLLQRLVSRMTSPTA